MSPENDLLFAQSLSDFGNLTEFEDFPKDLFMSNGMEGIAGGVLLEELDCKDAWKHLLISEVNNAFSASLKVDYEKLDVHSPKAHGSPITIFLDDEPSGPIGFMAMASKLESPTSDGLSIKSMGSTSLIGHSLPSGCAEQGALLFPRTLLATNKVGCMTLDELDMGQLHATDELSALSELLQQAGISLVTQGSMVEPAPTLPPLSTLGKTPVTRNLFSSSTQVNCSADTTTPSVLQINSPVMSPSMATPISASDGGSLLNRMSGHEEGSNTHILKGIVRHSVTDLSVFTECSSLSNIESPKGDSFVSFRSVIPPHVMQESLHNSTMQRSHSSHALGQLRKSDLLGPSINEFGVSPASKMALLFSSASYVNPLAQYPESNTQGLAARSPIAPMRHVYSTGDLQAFNSVKLFNGDNPENANTEESAGLKIGHYTVEERKMKLHRYRQKRTERNFSRKIKYACRKTLADSRPRVKGRFARNDEMGEPVLKDENFPHIDEYKEMSRWPCLIPEEALLMANNRYIMSNNPTAQFWSAVGMKVAM